MPATLAMPTKAPLRRWHMAAKKGWNVAAMPRLLVSKVARSTSRSAASAVSMPMLMPALAITTSGTPCAAITARPMAAIAARSRTSAAWTETVAGAMPCAAAHSRSASPRRATSASRQPARW